MMDGDEGERGRESWASLRGLGRAAGRRSFATRPRLHRQAEELYGAAYSLGT
jgi:hypothetical protein